jgi:hypothetical protein
MIGLFGTTQKKRKRHRTYVKYKTYDYEFYGRKLSVQGYERQALEYLVSSGFRPSDILTECEFGDGLKIRYKYRGRVRTYMPDIFIRGENIIVEVKSKSTLGLLNNKRRGWSMTCQKAIACHKRGFRFCLLLLTSSGKRIRLPKNWPYMRKQDVIDYLEDQNL